MRNVRMGMLLGTIVLGSVFAKSQEQKALSAIPADGFSFTGAWDCKGTFRSGKPHRATMTASIILAGKWLEITEEDLEPATGYIAKYLIGFDAQRGQLTEFDANNLGAAVYTSLQGWQESVLTLSSPVTSDTKAPYAADRFLYTILSKNTFGVDWQVSRTANLNWVTADHLVCSRN